MFTTVPAEVYAEIGDTIGNSQEQNAQILDDLKEITGSEASAEQAMAQLQDMGLLDEEGKYCHQRIDSGRRFPLDFVRGKTDAGKSRDWIWERGLR